MPESVWVAYWYVSGLNKIDVYAGNDFRDMLHVACSSRFGLGDMVFEEWQNGRLVTRFGSKKDITSNVVETTDVR
jgi:hypothetical protein